MVRGRKSGFVGVVAFAMLAAPVAAQEPARVRQTSNDLEAQVSRLAAELTAQRNVEMELRRIYSELLTRFAKEDNERLRTERQQTARAMFMKLQEAREQQLKLRRELETVCMTREKPQGWFGVALKGEVTVLRQDGADVYRYGGHPTVVTVDPGSPADKAGIRAEDVIVAIGGRDLRTGDVIASELLRPGAKVPVTVARSGGRQNMLVYVEERPESFEMTCPWLDPTIARAIAPAPPAPPEPTGYRYFIFTDSSQRRVVRTPRPATTPQAIAGGVEARGVEQTTMVYPGLLTARFASGESMIAGAHLMVMNEDLGQNFGTNAGLLVLKVVPGTPAQRSGLKAGDVLLKAADQSLTTPRSLQRIMELASEGSKEVKLTILRQRQQQVVVLKWSGER